MGYEAIVERSQAVLDSCHIDGKLVPHPVIFKGSEFGWDTAVMAEAEAYYNPREAAHHIIDFYDRGQTDSGNLTNEILTGEFHPLLQKLAFGSLRSKSGHLISPRTQPPLLIGAAYEVSLRLSESESAEDHELSERLLQTAFKSQRRYSDYMFDHYQDSEDELVVLDHGFNSGMDDTPPISEAMLDSWHHQRSSFEQGVQLAVAGLLGYFRRKFGDGRNVDGRSVPLEERASNLDVITNFRQSLLLNRLDDNLAAIRRDPRIVLIKDVGFNAVFAYANQVMEDIGYELASKHPFNPEYQLTPQQLDRMYRHHAAINRELWQPDPKNPERGTYYSKNDRTSQLIPIQTIASLYPLLAGVPEERQQVLIDDYQDPNTFNHSCMAVPLSEPEHLGSGYWQLGEWVFSKAIFYKSLLRWNFYSEAAQFRERELARPNEPFKCEYGNPITGKPMGVHGFGPTAAFDLTLVEHQKAL